MPRAVLRDAVILAAGRGRRMGRLTEESPKCMVKLAGRSLLEWQIAALKEAGVDRLTIVRGFLARQISGSFTTIENPDWAATNMVRSLERASAILSQVPCLVVYSDIVFHPSIVERLARFEADIAIAVDVSWRELWSLRFEDPLLDAETLRLAGDRIVDIGRRAARYDEIQGQYIGLTRLTPDGWMRLAGLIAELPSEAVDRLDMTGLLRVAALAGAVVRAVPIAGRWCEVDSEADLLAYAEKVSSPLFKSSWSHDWRW